MATKKKTTKTVTPRISVKSAITKVSTATKSVVSKIASTVKPITQKVVTAVKKVVKKKVEENVKYGIKITHFKDVMKPLPTKPISTVSTTKKVTPAVSTTTPKPSLSFIQKKIEENKQYGIGLTPIKFTSVTPTSLSIPRQVGKGLKWGLILGIGALAVMLGRKMFKKF